MNRPYRKYLCTVCGHVYDEARGMPKHGISAGTRLADLPDDWVCPECRVGKELFALLDDHGAAPTAAGGKAGAACAADETIVVVGSGIAGWQTVEQIRARDSGVHIVLVTADGGDYYQKPQLSVALSQQRDCEDLVQEKGVRRAARLDVELKTGTRALAVDAERRLLHTDKGPLAYDYAVLATGARQRPLPLAKPPEGLFAVNDLDDYEALRRALSDTPKRVAIVGAGLIGCEMAEDLMRAGHEVSLIDRNDLPLAELLPRDLAARVRAGLAASGARWKLGETVAELSGDGPYRLTLEHGGVLDADLVLTAIGVMPNVLLARKSGLEVNRGIVVDACLRTSDPRIFALGDCAEVDGHTYAYVEPIHRQARVIAATLMGEPASFSATAPLVRPKLECIELIASPPRATANVDDHWQYVDRDGGCVDGGRGDDLLYVHRGADEWDGFAASGARVALASTEYSRLKAVAGP